MRIGEKKIQKIKILNKMNNKKYIQKNNYSIGIIITII